MMNKYKYLFKNIGLLALSNFATKLISFFLVPLYTNILTTTEYGTYDLFYTTINVLIPILTLNINDAVLRFSIEKNVNKNAVATISIRYFIFGSIFILFGLVINAIFNISEVIKIYACFFFMMFFSQSLSGIVSSFARGIDKIRELSISSVIASVIIIGCNVLFLVIFRWGLKGYFLANIIGPLVQCLYLMICTRMTKYIKPQERYIQEKKGMLAYSKPLIANSVAWWINNASDRYIVIFFCGIAANGIYSIASKIPSILNIFQTIFNQAWTMSAVKEYDPEDKSGFFANTYKAYNCLMVILCSLIIATDKFLASFLYVKDFYTAWKYVPWLTIAIIFGALSGYIGGFFSAVKESKIFAQTTIIGAVLNIVMNIFLIPLLGPLGAAIATGISYFIVWLIRYIRSQSLIKLRIRLCRDLLTYAILVIQSVVLLLVSNNVLLYVIQYTFVLLIMILYIDDIMLFFNKCQNKLSQRR